MKVSITYDFDLDSPRDLDCYSILWAFTKSYAIPHEKKETPSGELSEAAAGGQK